MLHAESVPSPRGFDRLTLLVAAFRLAITSKCLGLCLVGLVATTIGWKGVGLLLPSREASRDLKTAELDMARDFDRVATSVHGEQISRLSSQTGLEGWVSGQRGFPPIDPVFGVPYRFVEPFRRLFLVGRSWTTLTYYLLGGLASLAIWAFFGGAVTRIAMVQLALQQPLRLHDAVQFALSKWTAFFLGPTFQLIGIAMLAFPFIALGWLMALDIGVLLGGVLWVGVLIAGMLMAALALGLLFGWPLMWGTISSEASDGFDAISRSYGYTMHRPLHYAFYALIAAALGLAGWFLAWWFAETAIDFGYWAISLGCGNDRALRLASLVDSDAADASPALQWGAEMIGAACLFVRMIASAFSYSFFWCVTSAIYLLLRRDKDGTPLDKLVFDIEADVRAVESMSAQEVAPTS